MGVDNCRIEVEVLNGEESSVEVPIFDGSAKEWVEAIEQVGLKVATDQGGNSCEKMIPFLIEPVHVHRNDSFIAAFPYPKVQIIYGINFPQVPAIGCQWFSSTSLDDSFYTSKIGPSRTFCIYEEVLDLIGDLSLFARHGSQGFPVAQIVGYKACFFHCLFPSKVFFVSISKIILQRIVCHFKRRHIPVFRHKSGVLSTG
ncbi:hypothetical protein PVL29_000527 [Vitis rotundifolia]|uniref:UDP-3-O-acyl-N-acetylglucosamine deacetylase n=1 Tax=Vitis rotundifolia TaxID=103349 RepID=A0AA39E6I8_VITRO|nr:hypothetical protein PVL29_000527 [Vitis rotundifolia]